MWTLYLQHLYSNLTDAKLFISPLPLEYKVGMLNEVRKFEFWKSIQIQIRFLIIQNLTSKYRLV